MTNFEEDQEFLVFESHLQDLVEEHTGKRPQINEKFCVLRKMQGGNCKECEFELSCVKMIALVALSTDIALVDSPNRQFVDVQKEILCAESSREALRAVGLEILLEGRE